MSNYIALLFISPFSYGVHMLSDHFVLNPLMLTAAKNAYDFDKILQAKAKLEKYLKEESYSE